MGIAVRASFDDTYAGKVFFFFLGLLIGVCERYHVVGVWEYCWAIDPSLSALE